MEHRIENLFNTVVDKLVARNPGNADFLSVYKYFIHCRVYRQVYWLDFIHNFFSFGMLVWSSCLGEMSSVVVVAVLFMFCSIHDEEHGVLISDFIQAAFKCKALILTVLHQYRSSAFLFKWAHFISPSITA